mgnify:CR=1 FL=1
MKIIIGLTLIFFCHFYTNAQSIGVGMDFNHMTNGLLIGYSPSKSISSFRVVGGLRYIVNHYSELKINKQRYTYYKQGYAEGIFEHFGFFIIPSIKILKFNFLEIGALGNFTASFNGRRSNEIFSYFDEDKNKVVLVEDISSFKASPTIDVLLGLYLKVNIKKRLSFSIATSAGVTYMHHKRTGKLLKSGKSLEISGNGIINGRGHFEASGFEKLPNFLFSANYQLR